MRGRFLKLVVWLMESPLGGIVGAKSMRDSGVPQVSHERRSWSSQWAVCGSVDGSVRNGYMVPCLTALHGCLALP